MGLYFNFVTMTLDKVTIEDLNQFCKGTLVENVGIEFTKVGKSSLTAKMPVDERTIQPMKLLHGGANVVLAETLGSICSAMLIDQESQFSIGLEVNANHIRSVRSGFVHGTCSILHKGKSTHVWNIEIKDDDNNLVSVCRLTVMVVSKTHKP